MTLGSLPATHTSYPSSAEWPAPREDRRVILNRTDRAGTPLERGHHRNIALYRIIRAEPTDSA